MKTKTDIVEEIKRIGFPDNEVAISMDDFFDNENYSYNCIGVNIYPDAPTPEKFYEIFKELIASKKADRILVRISDIDEPEEWFYSDTVYVIGSLTLEELKNSIETLYPDEIYENFMYGKPANIADLDSGQKAYSIWWD
jgi:hypothetical protein